VAKVINILQSFPNEIFSYISCVAVDKISADIASRGPSASAEPYANLPDVFSFPSNCQSCISAGLRYIVHVLAFYYLSSFDIIFISERFPSGSFEGGQGGGHAPPPKKKVWPLVPPVKFVMHALSTQLGGSHMLDLRLYAAGFREQFSFGMTLKSSYQEAGGL